MGYTVKVTDSGTSLIITAPTSRGGGTPSVISPWDLTISTSITGDVTLTVWPGAINGLMPTNMFDVFTIDATGLWYLIATVTTDGTAISSCVLSASHTAPSGQVFASNAMPSTVSITVGVIKAGLIYNIWKKNITMTANVIAFSPEAYNGIWAIG